MIIVAPGSLSEGFTIRVFPGMFVSVWKCQTFRQPTSDGCKRCRPEDDHCREVERGYGSRDSQGKPSDVGVHVVGNLKLIPEQGRCNGGSIFDDLEATTNVSESISISFALL